MTENKINKKAVVFHVIFCLIITILIITTVSGDAQTTQPTSDDYQYFIMGYNIQKYGTFSMNDSDIKNPEPTAYRDPGFPAYLALCMKLSPKLSSMSLKQLMESGLKTLRYLQIPLIIIIAFLTMYLAYIFTKNWLLAYLALIITGFSEVIGIIANHLLSENLASLLIILCSLFLYKIYKTKKIVYFILLGISLAILTLTKAIFMYFIIILLIILIVLLFKHAWQNRKKFIAGIILLVILYSVIIGGWMFRNYTHFNQWTITKGGGIVLYYRSKLDTMTGKEFMASFIYWLPGEGVKEKLLDKFFNKEDYIRLDKRGIEGYKTFAHIDRKNLVDSYISKGYTEQDANLLADKDLRSIAIKNILKNPLKHLLVIIPIAWFSIWVETGYKAIFFNQNLLIFQLRSVFFIPLIMFICYFSVIIWSIVRKKIEIILFFTPSFYLFLIQVLVTHGKPRYNFPLIPLLDISIILMIFFIFTRYKEKKALKTEQGLHEIPHKKDPSA